MILLEFENLERDRPLIDVMIKCFEDSVKLLEQDLQPEMYRKQLKFLNVLKMFVTLLRDEHSELTRSARHILQKQPALSDSIINKLRDLLTIDEHKVAAILQERLQLPHEAF